METPDPNNLVTLTTRPTEFEANALVVVLRDAGIEAFAFGAPQTLAFGQLYAPVPVQVRRADLDRARLALEKNVSDSVDLDWDSVDVGERVDDLPLTASTGMPLLAKIGYAAAVIAIVVMLLGALVMLAISP